MRAETVRAASAAATACAAAILAAAIFLPDAARADAVADFYRGKTITLAVSTSAGGDYDQRARLLARHMPGHLPGTPTIIVQNMPGAGGMKAMNWLYNVAPKDGTQLASPNQQMPLSQAFGTKGVEFDLTRCAWIGNTMSSPIVLVSWHDAPVKRMEDAFTNEMVVGGTGAGSASVQFPLMLNALLGTKFKVISGYPGGTEIYLAMERGEVHGRATQNWAGWVAQKPDWIRDRTINLLAQGGTKRLPELKDVPLIVDYAKDAEARQVIELFLSPDDIARPIIGGPNLPGDRVQALRAAFDATMTDAGFLADAKRSSIDIIPTSGADAETRLKQILSAPKSVVEKAKMFGEGG